VKFLSGTVYSKALAIFLAASLLLLGAVVALTQLIIFREFNLTEQREMKATLQRFSVVMSRETRPLEVSLSGWSSSTFIANFLAQPPLEPHIERIVPEALRELRIDFVGIFDGRGILLRSVGADGRTEDLLRNGELLPALLAQTGVETSPLETESRIGHVLVGDQLCSIVISPVAKAGILMGGKLFDQSSWGFLEGLFSATIRFHTLKNTKVNEVTGRDIMELLVTQEVVIEAEDSSQITGYRLIRGFDGNPLGYISISQPRPLRQEGLRAIQIFLTGICLAGGALVLVVWLLLDRTILARIKNLTKKLDAERRSGRLPVQLNFQGDDELGALARSIEGLALLLQSTQFQYRAVVEDQTELICRFDADRRLAFANQVFNRMFKLEEKLLPDRRLDEVLPDKVHAELMTRFQLLIPEKPLATYTHGVSLAGGEHLWFRTTLRRHFSGEGNCQGGQWVAADITAQIEAQKQTLESERRFRRLFETASDGILLVERETLIISDINPALFRMLMLAGAEVLGSAFDQLPVFSPCLDIVNYYRRSEFSGGHRVPFRNECRLERADGSALFIELRCSGYEVAGGHYIQLNFRNISERVIGEQELRKLSAKLLRLQDEERRRIARELHDSTAQNLSALEMNMSLLEPLLEKSHPKAAKIVAETRQIAGECSRELRNISYLLHPPLIDEVGLAFAIKWFADGFAKRTGIAATVDIEEDFPRLDSDVEMPLFRVVQEAMTNIYRHSGADHAWVTLQREGRFVNLEIRDNGRGFAGEILLDEDGAGIMPEIQPGVGLAGMRERMANLGGKLAIENSPLGVTICVRLALSEIKGDEEPTDGKPSRKNAG